MTAIYGKFLVCFLLLVVGLVLLVVAAIVVATPRFPFCVLGRFFDALNDALGFCGRMFG